MTSFCSSSSLVELRSLLLLPLIPIILILEVIILLLRWPPSLASHILTSMITLIEPWLRLPLVIPLSLQLPKLHLKLLVLLLQVLNIGVLLSVGVL